MTTLHTTSDQTTPDPTTPDPTKRDTTTGRTKHTTRTGTSEAGALRWQRRCLGLGGVLFAIGNLLHPLEHNDAAYDAPTWEAAHLTMLVSAILIVLGLPALHRTLVGRVPHRTATGVIVTMVVGFIAIAPGTIIEAFVAPMIGHEGMEELAESGMAITDALGGIAFLGGMIALGWTIHRARLRPGWAGLAILACAVIMLVMMGGTGPVAGAIVIAGTAALGIALLALALC